MRTILRQAALFAPTVSPYVLMPQRERQGQSLQITYDLSILPAGQTAQLSLVGVDPAGSEFVVFTSDPLTVAVHVFEVSPSGNTTIDTALGNVPDVWFLRETFGDVSGLAVQRSITFTEGG